MQLSEVSVQARRRMPSSLLAPGRWLMSALSWLLGPPGEAVLAPYSRQPSRLWHRTRALIILTIVALVGAIYGFFFTLLPPAFLQILALPIALLVMVVIWVLPDRHTAPATGTIEWLFFAYWIVSVVWPNYLAIALPGLPWITFERLTAGPMMLLFLITLSSSNQLRRELGEILGSNKLITRMVIGYALVQIVSIPFSMSLFSSVQHVVDQLITQTMVFILSAYLFTKEGRISRWVRMFLVMAVITGIIGLIEYQRRRVLWADHIPSFLKIQDEAVLRTLAGQSRAGTNLYRPVSTFSVSLTFAEFMAMATPFIIHIFIQTKRNAVRFLMAAIDLVLLIAIFFTGARLGMVGFIFSHSVYGLLWAIRRWRSDRTSIFAPAVTLSYPAILGMVMVAVLTIGRLRNAVIGDGSQNASNDARQAQYEMFWPRLFSHPLGHGPGMSGEALGFANAAGVVTVDSYFVTVGLDSGIGGLVLFFGLIFVGIVSAVQLGLRVKDEESSFTQAIAITFGSFFLIKLVLSQNDNQPIFFMLLGMIVALAYRQRRKAFEDPQAAPAR